MTKIIVKDDFGYNLDFTFNDTAGDAVDITGLVITLKARALGSTTTFLTKTCTIDTAASGTCHYTVADGDFNTVGLFEYELEASSSTTKLITAPGVEKIKVIDSIA